MKTIVFVILVLFVPLRASEITFEAVAEARSSRRRLQEFFLDSYDAISGVIRDRSFKWEDTDGRHEIKLERAKLVGDGSKLTLQVVFDEEISAPREAEISKALEAAAWQRFQKRLFADADKEAKIQAAHLLALIEAFKSEQDPTRKRILAALVDASGPRADGEPPSKFFGLRRRS